MIDDPSGDDYYGGAVSAPVFARVMAGAARLLQIPPDLQPQVPQLQTAGVPAVGTVLAAGVHP